MYHLISDVKLHVHNNDNDYVVTPLLVTCVIAVRSIYMVFFQELVHISENLIFI